MKKVSNFMLDVTMLLMGVFLWPIPCTLVMIEQVFKCDNKTVQVIAATITQAAYLYIIVEIVEKFLG